MDISITINPVGDSLCRMSTISHTVHVSARTFPCDGPANRGAGTGSKPSNGVDVEDPYLIVGSPLVVTNNPSFLS